MVVPLVLVVIIMEFRKTQLNVGLLHKANLMFVIIAIKNKMLTSKYAWYRLFEDMGGWPGIFFSKAQRFIYVRFIALSLP